MIYNDPIFFEENKEWCSIIKEKKSLTDLVKVFEHCALAILFGDYYSSREFYPYHMPIS